MKQFLCSFLITILSGSAIASPKGTIDAAVMKFKVYKFAASLTTDCKNPITIFSDANGVEKDMLAGPTFGSGPISAGIYPCVMIEVSKIISDLPVTSTGADSAGCNTLAATATPQKDVICQNDQKSQLIDGTSVTCSGDAANDQHVTLFLSTIANPTDGEGALLPPASITDTTRGIKLTSPFVVTGDTAGTLSVKKTNFFMSTATECGSSAPTFSFN